MHLPPSAVLLDVGGTLWPQYGPAPPSAGEAQRDRLRSAVPSLTVARCTTLMEAIEAGLPDRDDDLAQATDRIIGQALGRLALPADAATVTAIRRAICLPAAATLAMFDGAHELLATIKRLGLCSVIVSNVTWRDAELYRRDFEDLGVSPFIDAVVTSLDVGFLKPHPAIFQAAVAAAGCPPQRCVMIGDSEQRDIAPAVALGMRAVLVAIEEPKPATTAAHAVATSLYEVAAIVEAWAGEG